MMKQLKNIFIILGIVLCVSVVISPMAGAVDPFDACSGASDTLVCQNKGDSIGVIIKNGVNLMLYVLSAVAVIMIIYAGILFTTSGDNSATLTKAKDTILYSVVGLVVAICSYAIVNFVLTNFK